jgi:hypothetical protein
LCVDKWYWSPSIFFKLLQGAVSLLFHIGILFEKDNELVKVRKPSERVQNPCST